MSLPKNSKTASACSSAVGGASAHVHWGCLLASALAFGCSGGVRGEGDVDEPSTATSEQSGDSATSSGSATPTGSSTSTGEPFTTGGTTSSNGGVPAPTTTVVENPSVAPTSFACDATAVPSTAPLRRLSAVQYQNSVRDVILRSLGAAVDDGSLDRALEASWGELAADERLKVPEDLHGSYRRVDQRVQQPHVDGWYASGVQVGQWLTVPERFATLLGDCNPETCLRDFVTKFGRLVLRRPLTDEDIALYSAFYAPSTGIDPAGYADVIAGLLNSPEFLYLVEGRGAPLSGREGVTSLTAHELAARLSYHFWDTTPDAELSALADSGALLEPTVYTQQVDRLLADARTRSTLSAFFREWLKLEDIQPLERNNTSAVFQAFAGENLPSPRLRDAVVDDALSLLDYHTFQSPGGVSDVFTSTLSFAKDAELASIYQAEPWDGVGAPPDLGEGRPGLLTRSALLVTGTPNTRPIMRGLFIRTALLCDTIAPPPAAAGATPPELSPDLTTREVVEQLTAPPACFGCHEAFINPLGFAFEGFDSLGRRRTEQRLFSDDGSEMGVKPVNTVSVPRVTLSDERTSEGPEDLIALLLESGKLEACLTRQYYRFTFGRWEGVARDGCALERMRQRLEMGGTLRQWLREVAFTEQFTTLATSENTVVTSGSNTEQP